mgnify:CR=1 FL=1|tara:strand:+ start:33 stop:476 length:444 start_codon:yes stop_codon:yes gene_type:complete
MSSNTSAFFNSAENNLDEQINQDFSYITDIGGNVIYVGDMDLDELSDSDNLTINEDNMEYDINVESIALVKPKRMKHNVEEMTYEELKEYSKRILANKKRYIKKYQQTANGKEKIKKASAKYYSKNRDLILQKKRDYYLKQKMKNSA